MAVVNIVHKQGHHYTAPYTVLHNHPYIAAAGSQQVRLAATYVGTVM